jgi:hypothetical protein
MGWLFRGLTCAVLVAGGDLWMAGGHDPGVTVEALVTSRPTLVAIQSCIINIFSLDI